MGKKAGKAQWSSAAFLVESMLLLVFLAVTLAVFVQTFGLSLARADEGEDLSRAVAVASSAAERFEADPAHMDRTFEADGMHVVCDVREEPYARGTLFRATIEVFDVEDAASERGSLQPVYSVSAARYVGEVVR